MGEKPLYIYQGNNEIFFASELKALLKSRIAPFTLDPSAVDLFFHYEYVPEPFTPIQGVRKLPAGHYWIVDADDWRITEKCYWRMEDAPPLRGDPVELIRAELEKASEIILRSDVPVGIALSGGIDSSAVAALTSRKSNRELHAFCVGYPDSPDGDERVAARQFAEHLRLPFHEVELRTTDLVDFFPQLIYSKDDLIADPSGYGYYSVMKLAREHQVPVMLQGQGGDELFWGYSWVRQAVQDSERKSRLLRKDFRAVLDYFYPLIFRGGRLREGWHDLLRDLLTPANQLVFYDLVPDFAQAEHHLNTFYTKQWCNQIRDSAQDYFTLPQPWPDLPIQFTGLISQMYLLANGIAQGDRLSMASSVELRLPLVDHRLIETVIGLRKMYPDHALPPKTWLKSAVADVLPEWVLARPKRGFAPPVDTWYSALFANYGSMLRDGLLVETGLLKASAARELSLGERPPKTVSPLSYKSLVLEIWARQLS
jgi:asparagine synthase (glutamine-hydrolysing)